MMPLTDLIFDHARLAQKIQSWSGVSWIYLINKLRYYGVYESSFKNRLLWRSPDKYMTRIAISRMFRKNKSRPAKLCIDCGETRRIYSSVLSTLNILKNHGNKVLYI